MNSTDSDGDVRPLMSPSSFPYFRKNHLISFQADKEHRSRYIEIQILNSQRIFIENLIKMNANYSENSIIRI